MTSIGTLQEARDYLLNVRGCTDEEFSILLNDAKMYVLAQYGESDELAMVVRILSRYEDAHAAYNDITSFTIEQGATIFRPEEYTPSGMRYGDEDCDNTMEDPPIVSMLFTLSQLLESPDFKDTHSLGVSLMFLQYLWGNDVPDEHAPMPWGMWTVLMSVRHDDDMIYLMNKYGPGDLHDLLMAYHTEHIFKENVQVDEA